MVDQEREDHVEHDVDLAVMPAAPIGRTEPAGARRIFAVRVARSLPAAPGPSPRNPWGSRVTAIERPDAGAGGLVELKVSGLARAPALHQVEGVP